MEKSSKIFIAGHRGLVGSAIVRALQSEGYSNLIMHDRKDLDLANQHDVNVFFSTVKPEYVFLAAAKVGGIYANNTYRGDFIYQNLAIQLNVIEAARQNAVKRLLFLGSSCIYPRQCPQPMQEEYLLQSALEPTNEPYAIAKIAGIKLCEAYNHQYGTDFASVMPTNLYGPGDNFDLQNSHVLPAILRKVHEAKVNKSKHVVIWGTGNAMREFLYVDDMASACMFIMNKDGYKDMLNIGTGHEVTIKQAADLICEVVGYSGELVFDTTKPDGTLRKLVDTTKLSRLGWAAKVELKQGLKRTYEWYLNHQAKQLQLV